MQITLFLCPKYFIFHILVRYVLIKHSNAYYHVNVLSFLIRTKLLLIQSVYMKD